MKESLLIGLMALTAVGMNEVSYAQSEQQSALGSTYSGLILSPKYPAAPLSGVAFIALKGSLDNAGKASHTVVDTTSGITGEMSQTYGNASRSITQGSQSKQSTKEKETFEYDPDNQFEFIPVRNKYGAQDTLKIHKELRGQVTINAGDQVELKEDSNGILVIRNGENSHYILRHEKAHLILQEDL